jgi:hypothetical protein
MMSNDKFRSAEHRVGGKEGWTEGLHCMFHQPFRLHKDVWPYQGAVVRWVPTVVQGNTCQRLHCALLLRRSRSQKGYLRFPAIVVLQLNYEFCFSEVWTICLLCYNIWIKGIEDHPICPYAILRNNGNGAVTILGIPSSSNHRLIYLTKEKKKFYKILINN